MPSWEGSEVLGAPGGWRHSWQAGWGRCHCQEGAFAEYRVVPEESPLVWDVYETFVPPHLRGGGLGQAAVEAVFVAARDRGAMIRCTAAELRAALAVR